MGLIKDSRNFMMGFGLGFGTGFVARDAIPYLRDVAMPLAQRSLKYGNRSLERLSRRFARVDQFRRQWMSENLRGTSTKKRARKSVGRKKRPTASQVGAKVTSIHARRSA